MVLRATAEWMPQTLQLNMELGTHPNLSLSHALTGYGSEEALRGRSPEAAVHGAAGSDHAGGAHRPQAQPNPHSGRDRAAHGDGAEGEDGGERLGGSCARRGEQRRGEKTDPMSSVD